MKDVESLKFCDIDFNVVKFYEIYKRHGEKKLLICAPSGPGLATIYQDDQYKEALMNADYNIFDSGLFTLLLRISKISVVKYSGLYFFKDIIKSFKKNKEDSYILVNPTNDDSAVNDLYMQTYAHKSNFKSYIAPIYDLGHVIDFDLLDILNEKKPGFIIINIGGGIQEKLGSWLKERLNYNATIICIGAAISFETKGQASIPHFIDRFYMGWLARCIKKPSVFIPRYFRALKFVGIFLKNKSNITVYYKN